MDLWIDSLDQDPAPFLPFLAAEENERAAAFYFEKDRRKYQVGRGLLRRVLGRYLGTDPAQVSIAPDAFGKPRLAQSDPPLDFNLSHSGDGVLFAITDGTLIGVDLESVSREDKLPDCMRTICSSNELSRYAAVPEADLPRALLRLWTAKESFLKAIGTGLHVAPDRLEIPASISAGAPESTIIQWLDSAEVSAAHAIHPLPDCEEHFGFSAAVTLLDPGMDEVARKLTSRPS